MSYYALFKGWLLLSQPPGCLGDRTSFDTEPALGGLSRRSGLFPSRPWSLSPTVSLPRHGWNGIRSLIGFGRLTPPSPFRALPPSLFLKAAPQCISGRTSYLRVRLAFHLYPQLIPTLCNVYGFGPPPRDYRGFTLAMGSSPGFGSTPRDSFALFRLAFAAAPGRLNPLTSPRRSNSPAHSSIGTPSSAHNRRTPTACRPTVSGLFHSPSGVLFTFPSRYLCAIGRQGYLALEGGPPGFPRDSTCPVVLTNASEVRPLSPTGLSPPMAVLSRLLRLEGGLLTSRSRWGSCQCAVQPR